MPILQLCLVYRGNQCASVCEKLLDFSVRSGNKPKSGEILGFRQICVKSSARNILCRQDFRENKKKQAFVERCLELW